MYATALTGAILLTKGQMSFIGREGPAQKTLYRQHHQGLMFPFTISLAVGIAVGFLLAWHVYLVLSAQTTIEFYQNRVRKSQLKQRGEVGVG